MFLHESAADINARDDRFDATPAGWAIEYLRGLGGLLAIGDRGHALRYSRQGRSVGSPTVGNVCRPGKGQGRAGQAPGATRKGVGA
jgi:hypothetical protein